MSHASTGPNLALPPPPLQVHGGAEAPNRDQRPGVSPQVLRGQSRPRVVRAVAREAGLLLVGVFRKTPAGLASDA